MINKQRYPLPFLMLLLFLVTSITYGDVFATSNNDNDDDEDKEKIKEIKSNDDDDSKDKDDNNDDKVEQPLMNETEKIQGLLEGMVECPCPPPPVGCNPGETWNGTHCNPVPLPPPEPLPPVATIKPDNPVGNVNEAITLTGASSENAVSYKWEVDGNLTIVGSDSSAMVVIQLPNFPEETSELEVTLTVTNKEGESDSMSRNIQVIGLPPQPIEEVCGDGIDNNQNGQIDEGCEPVPPIEPPISNSSQILIGDLIVNYTDFGEIPDNNYTDFWIVPKMFDNDTSYESAWSQYGTAGWTVLLKEPINVCGAEIIPFEPKGQNYRIYADNGFTSSGVLDSGTEVVSMNECFTTNQLNMEFNNPGQYNSIQEVKLYKDMIAGPPPVTPPVEPGPGNYTLNIKDSNINAYVSNSTVKFFFDDGVVIHPPIPTTNGTTGTSLSINTNNGGKN
jgi:hypothetical protein